MVHMLAYDNAKNELEELVRCTRNLVAYYSEDMWLFEKISVLESLKAYLEEQPIVDLACYDVSDKRNIDFLREIRGSGYGEMLLMLVADRKMSPMEYIKPEILASELLIKPYTGEQLREKLRDLLSTFCNKTVCEDTKTVFLLETKDGVTRIPFHQIYYFEAREKKIFVRTRKAEYPFYQTLEELERVLPEDFARCHRSYIVNRNMVERNDFSGGELILANGMSVPVSRTYKARMKALR